MLPGIVDGIEKRLATHQGDERQAVTGSPRAGEAGARYAMSWGHGAWKLVFAGQEAVIEEEKGVGLTAYHRVPSAHHLDDVVKGTQDRS